MKPELPDCQGCVYPGNCPCYEPKDVTVPVETLRILLHWAVKGGAEKGLYSVRKAVSNAREVLEK